MGFPAGADVLHGLARHEAANPRSRDPALERTALERTALEAPALWNSVCELRGASRGLVACKTLAASALPLTVKRLIESHWAGASEQGCRTAFTPSFSSFLF